MSSIAPERAESSLGQRLDSWKEIAAYLKRDIRTVQRWEQHEQLPVHRHLHTRLGSVYAYTAQLDAWWTGRGGELEAREAQPDTSLDRQIQPARRASRVLWFGAAAVCVAIVIALVSFSTVSFRTNPGTLQVVRFVVPPPDNALFTSLEQTGVLQFAVSPDGTRLAFVASRRGDTPRLWLRALESIDAQPLSGSEQASLPFWSPDGQSIGFFANGQLKRFDLSGATTRVLCQASQGRGGAWSAAGVILFSPSDGDPLLRVSPEGGVATPATTLNRAHGETSHRWPQFLPDGRHFIFWARGEGTHHGLYVGAIDESGATQILSSGIGAAFAAPDRLFYMRGTTLLTQSFDVTGMHLVGEPTLVAEGVARSAGYGYASVSVSAAGVVAYARRMEMPYRLQWLDRSGELERPLGSSALSRPRLSPDGKRVAATRMDEAIGGRATWILDDTHTDGQRLTFDTTANLSAVWSPDGRRIAFASGRAGPWDVYLKTVGGPSADEALLRQPSSQERLPNDWSPDGRFIVFQTPQPKSGWDLWAVPLAGERTPMPIVQLPGDQAHARFSPDGRWIAYASNESGRFEIYVQAFPSAGGRWQVSVDGGTDPVWRDDGRELFYLSAKGGMMAVPVRAGETFEPLEPQLLFRVPVSGSSIAPFPSVFDVTGDGQHFLMTMPPKDVDRGEIVVALTWQKQ